MVKKWYFKERTHPNSMQFLLVRLKESYAAVYLKHNHGPLMFRQISDTAWLPTTAVYTTLVSKVGCGSKYQNLHLCLFVFLKKQKHKFLQNMEYTAWMLTPHLPIGHVVACLPFAEVSWNFGRSTAWRGQHVVPTLISFSLCWVLLILCVQLRILLPSLNQQLQS